MFRNDLIQLRTSNNIYISNGSTWHPLIFAISAVASNTPFWVFLQFYFISETVHFYSRCNRYTYLQDKGKKMKWAKLIYCQRQIIHFEKW